MKRSIFFALVLAAICFSVGAARSSPQLFSLLSWVDQVTADRQDSPAISNPLDSDRPWESYNEWMCFLADDVEVSESAAKFNEEDGWRKIPLISAQNGSEYFEFDLPPEFYWDSELVTSNWRRLLDGSKEICIFAAQVKDLVIDEHTSVFELEQIKTSNGYWKVGPALCESFVKIDHSATDLSEEELGCESETQAPPESAIE